MGLTYVYHKSIATFFRAIIRPMLKVDPKPDEVISIPSRDTGRVIKAHIYKPAKEEHKAPRPVLINFCGSGYILPAFGADDEYCRFIADKTGFTVIDVQYRLAPEDPFPAAVNDAEDAVAWVQSLPDQFDVERISLSGFSAGANIALALSCTYSRPRRNQDDNVFRTVISFYGCVDMSVPTTKKTVVDRSNFVMRSLFPIFSHLCHKCLGFSAADTKNPRLSPTYAESVAFPDNVLIITAAQCPFTIEAEALADKIRNGGGKHVLSKRMDDCTHGWDKEAKEGTPQAEAKHQAYEMSASVLLGGLK
ncbi:hypothetical protein N7539_001271 [Penicillium diatomitis]|uniref:Alpha/beta hydrolase fold-3 domain-containing protein n=1 Tax=Penicillium diatomitis TaxID=2819901 RepID=A0A9W9XH49_9EURO|nr:uncharacterized protein N7539_001271 [Penicillium diatomitis]KAJ5492525.1 hypothetical protein N7539_001271 [Penicillium diatomitis]